MVCGDNVPDTCGDYFYLPLFPSCNLFLEAVPCFNHTSTIIVSMTTPAGERIYGFKVNYRSKRELSIFDDILKGRTIEGVLVRSTYDISLYLHKSSGDSLIVYPIDSYAREYEVPNMTPPSTTNINTSTSTTSTTTKTTTPTTVSTNKTHATNSSSKNGSENPNPKPSPVDSVIYVFSPFNSTTITITPFTSLESLPSAATKKTIELDAFEIHKHFISSTSRYIITSRDIFAVVLIQPKAGPLHDSMSLCTDMAITLFDFLPPGFMLGTRFYLAFPSQVAFTLILQGKQNATVDILTETTTVDVSLGSYGTASTDVTKTSSAWISTSSPVSVYVTISICSNSSLISSSSYISSALSSSSSSQSLPKMQSPSASSSTSSEPSSSSAPSSSSSSSLPPTTCSESGFFLPSVEHFFTCTANKSKDSCLCTCPSVFQREIHKNTFEVDRGNTSESTYFPLLVGELYDISTSISPAIGVNRTYDVIMTTNNSFMVFRHDFNNSNFLPAGSTLMQIYRICPSRVHAILLNSCQENSISSDNIENNANDQDTREHASSTGTLSSPECSCDDLFDTSSSFSQSKRDRVVVKHGRSRKTGRGYIGEYIWEEEEEDTTRPLIAVIVSLSVAIFAVILLILGYMLEEWISQRKLTRNTKIRPFVS